MIKWNSNCNRQRASCLWGEIRKRLCGDFSSWVVDDFPQFSPNDMWLQIAREPEKKLAFGEVGGIFRAQVLPAPLVRLIKSTSGQAHVVAQDMYNCEQNISSEEDSVTLFVTKWSSGPLSEGTLVKTLWHKLQFFTGKFRTFVTHWRCCNNFWKGGLQHSVTFSNSFLCVKKS